MERSAHTADHGCSLPRSSVSTGRKAYAAVIPTGVRYSLNSSRAVKAVSGKSEKTPSTPRP
jgi:hypothetical protein